MGVRSRDLMPLGWQIKCTQEKCVVDGQKKCTTGVARLRCPSNDGNPFDESINLSHLSFLNDDI